MKWFTWSTNEIGSTLSAITMQFAPICTPIGVDLVSRVTYAFQVCWCFLGAHCIRRIKWGRSSDYHHLNSIFSNILISADSNLFTHRDPCLEQSQSILFITIFRQSRKQDESPPWGTWQINSVSWFHHAGDTYFIFILVYVRNSLYTNVPCRDVPSNILLNLQFLSIFMPNTAVLALLYLFCIRITLGQFIYCSWTKLCKWI